MKPPVQPQTRWITLWNLLKRGGLYGCGASLLGGGLGFLLIGRSWPRVLTGLNIAGILLCLLAGSFAQGSFGVQSGVAISQARLGHAAPRMDWPLLPMLVTLVAAGVCFLLAWLLSGWH